jgi:hypothetical protein
MRKLSHSTEENKVGSLPQSIYKGDLKMDFNVKSKTIKIKEGLGIFIYVLGLEKYLLNRMDLTTSKLFSQKTPL